MSEGLGERRYDLDWVRITAFLLLIVYHVGMYYVTWDWHVKSPHASRALEPLMLLTSPWRLSLLFLVSGVATSYLFARQGAQGFLGRRTVRLLVPLAFGILAVVPPQAYLEVVEKLGYDGSYGDFLGLYFTAFHGFCRNGGCLLLPTWNHLWFVAYLWVYTAVWFLLIRRNSDLLLRGRRWLELRFVGLGVMVWPIVYLSAVRVLLASRFPSTHSLADDWYNHAVYVPMFVLGTVLAGTQQPWESIERLRWHALGFAALGWVFLCASNGSADTSALTEFPWLRRVWQIVFSAQIWLGTMVALGFARRHLKRDSAARRYLTTAVFPVYILHQSVIVVLAHALKPVQLDPSLEGVVLIVATVALCFLGYEGIRRVNALRPLFGLDVRARSESAAEPMSNPRK